MKPSSNDKEEHPGSGQYQMEWLLLEYKDGLHLINLSLSQRQVRSQQSNITITRSRTPPTEWADISRCHRSNTRSSHRVSASLIRGTTRIRNTTGRHLWASLQFFCAHMQDR
jgi:hypothetical protein